MKISQRDRVLLGVVAALAVCAAFYMLVLSPERHKVTHLQSQIAAARTTLATAQRREADGHAAESALRGTQTDWIAAQRAVPNVSNIPALLKVLARNAEAVHVSMQSISLSGSSASSAAGATASTAVHGATSIPVSLTFNGGYQALDRLVDRLDTLVTVSHDHLRALGPLVGISSVAVSPANQSSDPSELSFELTATVYQHSAASAGAGSGAEGS